MKNNKCLGKPERKTQQWSKALLSLSLTRMVTVNNMGPWIMFAPWEFFDIMSSNMGGRGDFRDVIIFEFKK